MALLTLRQFSREEFTALADIGAEAGQLDAKESRILKNLLRFPSLCAEDIITPRTVVFALQQDLTVHEAVQTEPELGFSRIPIHGDDRDEVAGFVLKTDVLLNEHRREGKARLRDLKREIRAVTESTPLDQVLDEPLDNRAHILLVVEGTAGLSFAEIEELKKLLVIRHVETGCWEWPRARAALGQRNRDQRAGGPIGFHLDANGNGDRTAHPLPR